MNGFFRGLAWFVVFTGAISTIAWLCYTGEIDDPID